MKNPLLGAALLAGALVFAPAANAAPTSSGYPDDTGYIAALQAQGIAITDTDEEVTIGNGLCVLMRKGMTPYDVASSVSAETNVTFTFAFKIASAAQTYLCPDAKPSSGPGNAHGYTS